MAVHEAAHARNFSHPRELAALIRLFIADELLDGANEPGRVRTSEVYLDDQVSPGRGQNSV